MGYRTVVILNNDLSHKWSDDPKLGRQIDVAAGKRFMSNDGGHFTYGNVIEVAHSDCQTLGIIDSHTFYPLAHTNWYQNQTGAQRNLQLLKDAADKMGYRLVRKSK